MPRTSRRPLVLTVTRRPILMSCAERRRRRDVQRAQVLRFRRRDGTVAGSRARSEDTRRACSEISIPGASMGVKARMKDASPAAGSCLADDARADRLCIWHVRAQDLGSPQSYGTIRAGPARRREAVAAGFRRWPGQVRRPSSEFSRRRNSSLTRSGTTWSAAIPYSSGDAGSPAGLSRSGSRT